ncbi:MAG TPA: hypothetical protein VFG69_15585 [Nannocystaceae bacterium]|nr:hypothetical protein [Nannocystaceae bacterium]
MACIATVAIPLPVLGAAPETGPGPAVQVPDPGAAEATAPIQRPGAAAEVVPVPTEPTTAAESTPDATTPSDATTPGDATTPPADAVPADMLEAEPAATTPAATTPAATTKVATPQPADDDDELSPSEAITAAYAPHFRPADNPGRFNLAARLLFANAGGKKLVGGRLGGLAVDLGQSWNHFGYALTGTVWGGRLELQPDTGKEINALIGVGPTVGLGRLAMLGRGYLDLRLGYDVYYGVVNRRSGETIVKGNDPGDVTLTKAKNLIPHGPRVRLDLGLLSLDTSRKFFHGFGLSMGYQALVGSMNGGMPPAHMLTLGLSYWMG